MSKILVVEDNPINARMLVRALKQAGHDVLVSFDGQDAWETLNFETFDLIITDWLMPRMDGPALIQNIHNNLASPHPSIIVTTTLDTPEAKKHALHVLEADVFLTKPVDTEELLACIETSISKKYQPLPMRANCLRTIDFSSDMDVPFVGVGVVAGMGGPVILRQLFTELGFAKLPAAFFIVLHGPQWMLETFVEINKSELGLNIHLAEEGQEVYPGHIYVAYGEQHMTLNPKTRSITYTYSEPENYCLPSADPLFNSIGSLFGAKSMALVLTGVGRDGAMGSSHIQTQGGTVLVQDPRTCTAPGLVQTILEIGLSADMVASDGLSGAIQQKVHELATVKGKPFIKAS